jgi:hypothetical protein
MPTTHRQQVLKALGLPSDTHLSVEELAEATDLPAAALQEVYNRGTGAWKSSPSSIRIKGTFEKNPDLSKYPRSARLTKEQWSMARVFSFVNKGKTFHTADADIAREYKLV